MIISILTIGIKLNVPSVIITNDPIETFDHEQVEDLDLKTSGPLDPKTGYAIVVGISDYPYSSNDLQYCDDDANEVRAMLINEYNFEPSNIYYFIDSSATRDAISNAFDTIAAQADSNDVFYFYYSGHGGTELATSSTYSVVRQSSHPYTKPCDEYWTITHPGALYMQVYFDYFEVSSADSVFVGDSDLLSEPWPYYYEYYGADYDGFWSGWVPLLSDGTLVINLWAPYSGTSYYGFHVNGYRVQTPTNPQYLCPYDSLSYPSRSYYDYLLDSKLDALSCAEKYVISDSCHSGGMIPESQASGRFIITACEVDEYSLEDSGRSNGCFTYNFLNSLNYATDSNGDGLTSMEEIYTYAYSTTVTRSGYLGYTHHPQQYDGITGEAILETGFGNLQLSNSTNELNYSFNLCGVGEIESLNLTLVHINSTDYVIQQEDLLLTASSATGFELYNSTSILSGASYITGYSLIAEIQGNELIILEESVSGDFDGDTIEDMTEIYLNMNPCSNDTDSDGLDDAVEYYGDTDPCLNDTDGDGLGDGDEVLTYQTNPINNDTDGDDLSDYMEIITLGTNATNSDSDDDGMGDGYEYYNDLNNTIDDSGDDHDLDGLSNLLECQIGSYANCTDSDEDTMPDIWEYNNDLDLMDDDTNSDYDNDGLINIIEYQIDTSANDSDSDSDGMPDGYEYFNNLNYTIDDSGYDYDSDELINIVESFYNSDPYNPDTDGDALMDGLEVNVYGTDILNPDTDGDGTLDGMEVALGLNPLDPKSSMLTFVLNIGGIALLGIVGTYATRAIVVHSKQKRKESKKVDGSFKIKGVPEKYNSLKVEEKTKVIPTTSYGYYKPPAYQQVPQYSGIPRNLNPAQQKAFIYDFIQNRLPRPYSRNEFAGQKALVIGTLALKAVQEMKFEEALNHIFNALQMGVPEPLNSQFRRLIISLVEGNPPASNTGSYQTGGQYTQDRTSGQSSIDQGKTCSNCGNINPLNNKFCTKCGRPI